MAMMRRDGEAGTDEDVMMTTKITVSGREQEEMMTTRRRSRSGDEDEDYGNDVAATTMKTKMKMKSVMVAMRQW